METESEIANLKLEPVSDATVEPTRRELTCILFPGIVRDHERAIQCLGGLREISKVYSKPTTKRLGLSFNPDNPLAKKTFGDLVPAAGLLLRVRVRKRRTRDGVERQVISTSVVGQVSQTYKFESMLDFTLLPTPLVNTSEPPCILRHLLPSGLDELQWIRGPAPSFIVPAHFTRSDRPLDYRYSDKKHGVTRELINPEDDVHYRLRPERTSHYTHVVFNLVEELPSQPNASAVANLQGRLASAPALHDQLRLVEKMLDERPIWSKNALQFHTKLSSLSLKAILPTLGIFCRGGPWRKLWIRFGYDPRKHPESRIYQTLDFRLRNIVGIEAHMTPRAPYLHKKLERVRHTERRNPFTQQFHNDEVLESAVIFREGLVPSQKQVYYQYCDLKVVEVEELLARAGEEVVPGALCHARRGWLPAGLPDRVRDILSSYVRRAVLDKGREGLHILPEPGSSSSGEDQEQEQDRDPEQQQDQDPDQEWSADEEFILPDMRE